VGEDISRRCPIDAIAFHLVGVDYDDIRPGCVLPTGRLTLNSNKPAGAIVTAVEIYGPGEHPLSELAYTPPADFTIVLYRTSSGRTHEAWVRPQYAHRIGCNWPQGEQPHAAHAANDRPPTADTRRDQRRPAVQVNVAHRSGSRRVAPEPIPVTILLRLGERPRGLCRTAPHSPKGVTMTNADPRVIKVTGPAGILAALHHVLGFHPSTGLYVVGLNDSRFACVFTAHVPDGDHIEACAADLRRLIAGTPVDTVLLVGYGPDQDVSPVIRATMAAMTAIGVTVAEAIGAHHGRYVSYLCTDPACCPPEGTPYDTSTGAAADPDSVPDSPPDRGGVDVSIAPEHGPSRTAVEEATRRTAEQIEAQMREPGMPQALITQARDLIGAAIEGYRRGERLSDEDAARLSVLLGVTRLRDEAWMTITPEYLPAHLLLWADMTRRTAVNIAACASLLAFAAWLDGNDALAASAINRALDQDPDYSMAHLMANIVMLDIPDSVDPPTASTGEYTAR